MKEQCFTINQSQNDHVALQLLTIKYSSSQTQLYLWQKPS